MSTFGQTLRQAREAKGYTLSQVAQETHILVQIIEGMENEDFHRIPAAIYGRGFVKAFAACVDLDPQPLIREFMDIYEGRRAPAVQVRTVPEAPAPVPPPPAPEPAPLWDPPTVSAPEPVAPAFSVPDPVPPPFTRPEPPPAPAAEPAHLWDPPAEVSSPVPDPDPVIPEPAPGIPEPVVPEPAPGIPDPVVPEPAPRIPEPAPAIPEPVIPEPAPIIPEPVIPEPSQAIPEPEPLWDPPAAPAVPEPDPFPASDEQPPIVRGLDLFEQTAVPPPAPTAEPPRPDEAPATPAPKPDGFEDSAFLPSGYEDHGPSAAERFRIGLSNVSDGVLKSVRRIPRSAWRIALLSLAAAGVIALLVFGCVKLYQATSTIPRDPCANGACEVDLKPKSPAPAPQPAPAAKPAAGKTAKAPAAQNAPKAGQKTAPKGPVKLRATGTKVPALYAD